MMKKYLVFSLMILVLVGFVSAEWDWTESFEGSTDFFIPSGAYKCVNTEDTAYWEHHSSENINIIEEGGCNATALGIPYVGELYNSNICCPANAPLCIDINETGVWRCEILDEEFPQECMSDGDCGDGEVCEDGVCVALEGYIGCGSIDNKEECNGISYSAFESHFYDYFFNSLDPQQRGLLNLGSSGDLDRFCEDGEEFVYEFGDVCNRLVGCSCKWNDDEGICKTNIASQDCIDDDPTEPDPIEPDVYSCRVTTSYEDRCASEGKYILKSDARVLKNGVPMTGNSDLPWCKSSEYTVSCVRRANISFFGFAGFVVSIMTIFAIYLFLYKRKIKVE